MFPATMHRVAQATPDAINERIEHETRERVKQLESQGAEAIEHRLAELEAEWDVERTLTAIAPTITLFGIGLALLHNRRWLTLPLLVQAFLLQHALQGWCPPLEIIRRMGVRTAEEIDFERFALKALRGDFQTVTDHHVAASRQRANEAIRATRSGTTRPGS